VVEAVYATVGVTIGQLAVVTVGPSLADAVTRPLVFQGTGAIGDFYVDTKNPGGRNPRD
jgi:hypothetical protein